MHLETRHRGVCSVLSAVLTLYAHINSKILMFRSAHTTVPFFCLKNKSDLIIPYKNFTIKPSSWIER